MYQLRPILEVNGFAMSSNLVTIRDGAKLSSFFIATLNINLHYIPAEMTDTLQPLENFGL